MTRGAGRGQGGGHRRAALLPQGEALRLYPMEREAGGVVVATRVTATAGGGFAGWGAATDTGGRLAGQRRRRPARGSNSSTLLLPKAVASSLALLAFLGDPAASFQVRCQSGFLRGFVCMGVGEPWLWRAVLRGVGTGFARALCCLSSLPYLDRWAAD